MKYGSHAKVDKPISRIVFGTAMPVMFNAFRSVYGEAGDFDQRLNAAFELLDGVYAQGVNCFDCSDHYGEEPLGEWLEARGLHDKVVILTKGAHHNRWRKRVTPFDILHDAHNSLAKLKAKKLDIYLLHRDDESVPVGPIMDALNRLYDEGKIGLFGASNWTLARMEAANDYALQHGLQPFGAVSPHFSLADQVNDPWGGGCYSIAGPSDNPSRRFCAENKLPVFAYSSLCRGFFSGRVDSAHPEKLGEVLDAPAVKGYSCEANFERLRRAEQLAKEKQLPLSQLALAYIFNQRDLDAYALVATSSPERMALNVAAAEISLSDAECAWLNLEGER